MLVVSNEPCHRGRQEVIIAGVTSNISRKLVGDTVLENWREARLKYPSLVTGILQTVKNTMIVRVLGAVSHKDLQEIMRNFESITKIQK